MSVNKEKPGTWIVHSHLLRSDEYECSICGKRTKKPSKTCPNCGSRLKPGKTDSGWIDEAAGLDAFFED